MSGQDLTDEMNAVLKDLKSPIAVKDEEINNLENQLHSLKPFRDLVYHIASKRQDSVDDYIRLAKQCIADYESRMT